MCPLQPDPPPTSLLTVSLQFAAERQLWVSWVIHHTCTGYPILHMVMNMFQCSSLKSSHPLPLPLSPKDCSLHLCRPCCPACGTVNTIFLYSVYMLGYNVCLDGSLTPSLLLLHLSSSYPLSCVALKISRFLQCYAEMFGCPWLQLYFWSIFIHPNSSTSSAGQGPLLNTTHFL